MDFERREKRRRVQVDSDLTTQYPHDLQMYRDYPYTEVSLPEFETLALERLKLLRILEQVSLRSNTKNYDEWKDLVVEEIRKQGLKTYSKLLTAPGLGVSEADLEARRRDHISHFILRFAYCQNEEYRRWFIQRELELFKMRWTYLTNNAKRMFLKLNDFSYAPITDAKCQELVTITEGYIKSGIGEYYEVPWTSVLELVRNKRVYIRNGLAYITANELITVVGSQFRSNLSRSLTVMSMRMSILKEDERLKRLIQNLHHTYIGKSYSANESGRSVDLNSIDSLAKTSFPLCMRKLHSTLRTEHHLRHFARQQFSLFLKGIGVSLEDALIFWRSEFTKKMDVDKFDKEYAYNIRHNYGKEGKRTNYTPYSCGKILSSSVGPGDQHGCPYRHLDQQGLKQLLKTCGLPNEAIHEISEFARQGHFQLACAKFFEVQHSVPMLTGISHPNQYFEESQKILKCKGTMPQSEKNITPETKPTSSSLLMDSFNDADFSSLDLDNIV